LRGSLAGQPSFRLAHPGGNLKLLARTKGYAYPKYLYKIAPHLSGSSADKLRVFLRFDEPHGATALLHEGIAIGLYCDGELELEAIERELRAAGIEDLSGFYRGLGLFLRFKFPRDIAMRAHGVESRAPEVRDALIEGLGLAGQGLVDTEDRVAQEVQIGIDSRLPEIYFVGLGRRMQCAFATLSGLRYHEMTAGPWMLERERAVRFATSKPEPIAQALLRGYDAAQREHWIDPMPWWLVLVP